MDFTLSEEQTLIRDMARDFAKNELAPNASDWDQRAEFPESHIRRMAELGLMGVNVPEELGGAEAGPVALSLAITEIAKGCASCAVTMSRRISSSWMRRTSEDVNSSLWQSTRRRRAASCQPGTLEAFRMFSSRRRRMGSMEGSQGSLKCETSSASSGCPEAVMRMRFR